ncbi:hypothetical protein ONA70_02310 [Micromonospora yasonensis]|uniref:hypothetical protein n=1 Tax=Micromonospora yasonensis TaxID=1128667 RepID=UPI00222F17B8|nr:hypothetical protein [Micromonospora yasonensis]MCW3838928.1 hypothetical protein [Micromonospora yasonensis]
MTDEHGQDEPGTDQSPGTPTLKIARQLAKELAGVATVEVDRIEGGISVGVTPRNPDARAFGWTDFSDELILGVGDHGGRWELEAGPEDLALLEDIARSVIAGRVREVFAPGRSAVSVTLADGSVETEIGGEAPAGCLPLPFWRRWSRSVQYAPYR